MTDLLQEQFPKTDRETLRKYILNIVAFNQQTTAKEIKRSRQQLRKIKEKFAELKIEERKRVVAEILAEDKEILEDVPELQVEDKDTEVELK